jgi:thymidylate synthase ThyX
MLHDRQVYLLDPQKLSPETIAVTFAKTSRSPQSFREIAAELTDEKSAEFNEKWVVGYGHASVAEHAVLHIALENVSRLAVETLESNRLASYTEKSTRYQKWDPESFFLPPELSGHPLEELYIRTLSHLFDTYRQALPAVRAAVAQENPCRPDETEAAWERRVRSQYVDVCRFLLPAASLANVGMTINARALEHAISKMLSHPLQEVRSMGREIKAVAQAEVPTLVKYANEKPYLQLAAAVLAEKGAASAPQAGGGTWMQLVDYDPDAEDRVLAAALYRYSGLSLAEARTCVQNTSPEERLHLAGTLLGTLDKFDIPLRELEYTRYTFDILMDQGAYFEVKRHRMMTQTPQALTARCGYALPRLITAAGIEGPYREAMEAARQAYETLAAFNPEVAAYVVPNGFNRRVLLSLNLRSALHFIRLRTASNAHFSVRRVAGRISQEIAAALPLFGTYITPAVQETWQDVETQNFTQVL